jgi:hypothetical protein
MPAEAEHPEQQGNAAYMGGVFLWIMCLLCEVRVANQWSDETLPINNINTPGKNLN